MTRSIENFQAVNEEIVASYGHGEPLTAINDGTATVQSYTGSETILRATTFSHVPSNNPDIQLKQLMEEPSAPQSANVPVPSYYARLGFGIIE